MKSKLTLAQRLKLVDEVISGKPASHIAKAHDISTPLLGKWLKRYKELGEKGLLAKSPGRPKKSKTPKKLGTPKVLLPQERLKIVQEVLNGREKVGYIARKYEVSRITLYKWLKRYKQSSEKSLSALEDKERKVSRYFRQTPEKYEEAVLNLISQRPEYGVRRLVQEVPKIGGKPIIGHHGIQNILKRHELSTYNQRLIYAQAQETPITRTIKSLLGVATRFFAIPQIPRTRIIRFGAVAALSMFATVVVFGLGSFIAASFVSASLATRIGLVFATSALIFGSIFFLYLLKYYLSLAIVLSFSQQQTFSGKRLAYSKTRGIISWILGLA